MKFSSLHYFKVIPKFEVGIARSNVSLFVDNFVWFLFKNVFKRLELKLLFKGSLLYLLFYFLFPRSSKFSKIGVVVATTCCAFLFFVFGSHLLLM